MDNLINILVAIIIIYSFLSPLFKKKKDGSGPSTTSGRNPYNPPVRQRPSYQNKDLDIFTEIEEMMNRGKIPSPQNVPQRREEVIPKDSDEHQPTPSEHKLEDWKTDLKSAHQKFKISEDERMNIERDLEKKFSAQRKVYYNPTFARVRSSFLNMEDFRNGFIISEILGKPKALRR